MMTGRTCPLAWVVFVGILWARPASAGESLLAVFHPTNVVGVLTCDGARNGIAVSNFDRSRAVLEPSTDHAGMWGTRNWSTGPLQSWSYIEFSVSARRGHTIRLSSITFYIRRSTGYPAESGPLLWQIACSRDGFVSDHVTLSTIDLRSVPSTSMFSVTVANFEAVGDIETGQQLTLRVYGYLSGAGGTAGLATHEPLVVKGEVLKDLARYEPEDTPSALSVVQTGAQLLASTLRRGPGIVPAAGAGTQWASAGWSTLPLDENDYVGAGLTVTGGRVKFDHASFALARSSALDETSGPATWTLRYRIAGLTGWNTLWSGVYTLDGPSVIPLTVDLDALPVLHAGETVDFRWYGYLCGSNGIGGLAVGEPVALVGQEYRDLVRFDVENGLYSVPNTGDSAGVTVTDLRRDTAGLPADGYPPLWGVQATNNAAGMLWCELMCPDGYMTLDSASFRVGLASYVPQSGSVTWSLNYVLPERGLSQQVWHHVQTLPDDGAWVDVDGVEFPENAPAPYAGERVMLSWLYFVDDLQGGVGFGTGKDVVVTGTAMHPIRVTDVQATGRSAQLSVDAEGGSYLRAFVSHDLSEWKPGPLVPVRYPPARMEFVLTNRATFIRFDEE